MYVIYVVQMSKHNYFPFEEISIVIFSKKLVYHLSPTKIDILAFKFVPQIVSTYLWTNLMDMRN